MIVIRKATAEDIPEVCRIVEQLSPGDHDYQGAIAKYQIHIEPSPDYYLWVALLDGKIVGTAMMHLQHKLSYACGTAAHLEDVVVDEPYRRGHGIGSSLVQEAIATAKYCRCYKIMLTCWRSSGSVDYYQRFGFKEHDVGMRLEL